MREGVFIEEENFEELSKKCNEIFCEFSYAEHPKPKKRKPEIDFTENKYAAL